MVDIKLEDYQWDALNCCGCKGCIWVDHIYTPGIRHGIKCPSIMHYFFDSYSALGRCKLALGLLEGSLEFSSTAIDIIYKCNLCGACDVGCKRNLDLEPLMILETLRIKAVEKGSAPPPPLKAIAQSVLETGNPYGVQKLPSNPETLSSSSAPQLVFFPGCNMLFNQRHLLKVTQNVLSATGLDFAQFPNPCCGRPLYVAGMATEAKAIAEANISFLERAGLHTIVTGCAECYKTWKVDYPKLLGSATNQMPYRVLHTSQLLDTLMTRQHTLQFVHPLPPALAGKKIAYHDACNLGRLSEEWIPWSGTRGKWGLTSPPKIYRRGTYGEYDSPRKLLMAIEDIELVEFPRNRENTLCCGSGGGVMNAFPDFAMATAHSRLKEAIDVGIEVIVTGCPFCLEHLTRAARQTGAPIRLYDIAEIVAHCLGLYDLEQH